ncbi:glycosyltransferase [Sporomusa sp. KB1]|jgi:glycosyltransferase involved in cell wall biosynthesis|uniref:glycosyltransferase n=1 Tax=Sporomusa sp. KB1 TaxID=943346 RepID=UPI0011A31591|nr:glycosyltransferase [Sporomusa sp. KB1]TWH45233.1 Glycosyltransferases involved in cell wall biogenesis [Sporomusa sp. KB1]
MKLSIGMMVKNEENNLERCLISLQPIRDAIDSELIIVDTGSEDNTVAIAKQYTDRVYYHKWNNHFSEMRNITISYAKGEWFLVIDADEELQETQPIIDFLLSEGSKDYGAAALTCKNITQKNTADHYTIFSTLRLFKNDGYFHYEGAVHNQQKFKGKATQLGASFVHYGYMSDDKELMDKKFNRTGTILKKELEKNPDNIYYWYQLSASYAMHKDINEAIESIEKAYQLFCKQKQQNQSKYIYVLTHRALVYKLAANYQKVEECCLECLTINRSCIDIYFHLAEAQAILSKCKEAIENYNNYLDLLARYDELDKNLSVVEYTLNNQELAYYNLVNLYKHTEDYEQALYCAEKLSSEKLILENMGNIIFLYVKMKKYQSLRTYYNTIKEEWRSIFYEKLSETVSQNQVNQETERQVAVVFTDIADEYGLYCRLLIEDEAGAFSNETVNRIQNIDFSTLPLYCSGILYYLLKWHYPLEKLFINFKEIWINCLFDQLSRKYDDLSEKIYDYLQNSECKNNLSEHKLHKALYRYVLLINKLEDAEYKFVFDRYLEEGILYLQFIYSTYILDNNMVYDVKNDEEVFLLNMYHASIHRESSQAKYLQFLRQALEAFPGMKRGIEILLKEVQESKQTEQNEFEQYKQQVKGTIKQLITNNQLDQAKKIIQEYRTIVPNDIEVLLFESQIFLN